MFSISTAHQQTSKIRKSNESEATERFYELVHLARGRTGVFVSRVLIETKGKSFRLCRIIVALSSRAVLPLCGRRRIVFQEPTGADVDASGA